MNAFHWNLEQKCLGATLSLQDLRDKLFSKDRKLDRASTLSEDKYSQKTLVGNWFERRTVSVPEPVDWRTTYDTDYKRHVNDTWHENQITKWDNKINLEGLTREQLLSHKKEYYNNMTTSYDLSYNILPKGLTEPRIRTYHARKRKWIPEQDLTKSYGSLTNFGLKDAIAAEVHENSEEGLAEQRWKTIYKEEIGQLADVNIISDARFRRRTVDFNVPDLTHFEHRLLDTEPCLLPFKIKNSKDNSRYISENAKRINFH
ncbi:cilia- and flagella-associated protein 107 [Lasioglossum baleicum]|uniref:cilia- and flagella-associated protein 107 n=1 Tax=Lasioglossum baleicum TaxID=434251 RepID=UPI003FCCE60B